MTDVHRPDGGLQPERTALSWNRTALNVTVNALLVLRAGLTADSALLYALASLLLVAAAGCVAYGWHRRRVLASDRAHAALVPHRVMLTVTGTAVLTSVAALAAIWLG